MDKLNFILSVLSVLILIVGLGYTYKLGKAQHAMNGKHDTDINEKVQDHTYIRNPIFLTYAIASVLVIAYIVYMTLSF